ncbi:hypothetical protein F5148DRAFT_1146821 [Russula earlei]|uniref:Uncharacterized protein n=1 Tax=Russula earlei TaxID=71964 RepID=A0ACC0UJK4_9AGAM|nr:hypothetical protein F5148DRAFT_1146821 [Russula earlei]
MPIYDNFGSPFDGSDADLILRSRPVPASELLGEIHAAAIPSDAWRKMRPTHFRVHKLFLIKASPVFQRLLSETSQSLHSSGNPDNDLGITRDNCDTLPVLCLSEDRETLHSLLTAIYPTEVAYPQTLEALMKIYAATKKYEMSSALALFRTYSTRVAPIMTTKNAFRAYIFAFNEALKEEALEAARLTLSLPHTIETYGEDLCIASGPALYALWRHRQVVSQAIGKGVQACVEEVGDLRGWRNQSSCACSGGNIGQATSKFREFTQKLIADFSLMTFPSFLETMSSQERDNCYSCRRYVQLDLLRLFSCLEQHAHRELFPLFDGSEEPPRPPGEQPRNFGTPFNQSDANLIIRSSDQVDFHVHKAVLGIASVVFDDMFTAPGPSPHEQGQDNQVINLTEGSKTLHYLLTTIYPVDPSIPETSEDALSLLATCHKYHMDFTATHIRSLLQEITPPIFTTPNSFHAYGIASRYNLKEETLHSARLTLERPLNFDECGEDLRFVSGAHLFRLRGYRSKCTTVLKDCISQMKANEDKIRPTSSYYNYNQRPIMTGWCYDHFLKKIEETPST